MIPEKFDVECPEDKQDGDEQRRSFHGQLLDRANTTRSTPRKRGVLARLSNRWSWSAQIVQFIGQGSIFAGGLAIGGGAMLLARGEPLRGLPGGMLAFGLAFILASILAKVVSREREKSWATAPRG